MYTHKVYDLRYNLLLVIRITNTWDKMVVKIIRKIKARMLVICELVGFYNQDYDAAAASKMLFFSRELPYLNLSRLAASWII